MTTTFNAAATKTVRVNGTNFVYREIGNKSGFPVVFLHHLTAVLEDWDPAIADGLAKSRPVIVFDNRGVGGSGGRTPDNVADMAKDAIAFIDALGLAKVDLFGFSLGGFIAQIIAQERPDLVRRIILAGTAPAGGEGIINVGAVLQDAIAKAGAENKHPKHLLFFGPSKDSQKAADAFLSRLSERKEDRDVAVTNEAIHAQVTASRNGGWRLQALSAPSSSPFWSLTATTTSWRRQSIPWNWPASCPMLSSAFSRMPDTAPSSNITMCLSTRRCGSFRTDINARSCVS
jgi:pimeloyl-ACP methyl ester carboxylesterase